MIGKFPRFVKVGDYVKFRGHAIQDRYYLQWWKVVAIEGASLIMVNRYGGTGRFPINISGVKAMVWEPGDGREDDKPSNLPR